MLTVTQFSQLKPVPLAVYGTDGGAIATDIYLRKLGLHNLLECFISQAANPPAKFCGKPVASVETLRQNPDMAVITANLDFNAVHNALRLAGLMNDYYYHASFWPWLDDEPQESDLLFLRGFYKNDDPHTAKLLETIIRLRLNSAICRIQPYETVKTFFMLKTPIGWKTVPCLKKA